MKIFFTYIVLIFAVLSKFLWLPLLLISFTWILFFTITISAKLLLYISVLLYFYYRLIYKYINNGNI